MLIRCMACRTVCLAAAIAAIALGGCKKEQAPTEQPKDPAAAKAPVETPKAAEAAKAPVDAQADQGAQVQVLLAKADAVDGAADKVVSKCGGCNLRMEGSEEHEITVSGYKMRFCSDDCKGRFEEEPTKSILAMKIPQD